MIYAEVDMHIVSKAGVTLHQITPQLISEVFNVGWESFKAEILVTMG